MILLVTPRIAYEYADAQADARLRFRTDGFSPKCDCRASLRLISSLFILFHFTISAGCLDIVERALTGISIFDWLGKGTFIEWYDATLPLRRF